MPSVVPGCGAVRRVHLAPRAIGNSVMAITPGARSNSLPRTKRHSTRCWAGCALPEHRPAKDGDPERKAAEQQPGADLRACRPAEKAQEKRRQHEDDEDRGRHEE